MTSKCIIVVGMHRSGTSALAGLLHNNGVVMGEHKNFSPGPSRENPKGFFENFRFRSINDMILAQNNYHIRFFNPCTPDVLKVSSQAKDVMCQVVYEYSKKYKLWGFKDPRTCLTINVWKNILDEYRTDTKTILILRNFDDIAASMKARGNIGTNKQFKDLAAAYYKSAISNSVPSIVISFHDLIHNTEKTAERLEKALSIKITNLTHIDPSISRFKGQK